MWGSLQCCVSRISSAVPAGSALGKARSVTTTWTAVTALMSKDAVSVLPDTGDLVAASKICFSPFPTSLILFCLKETELVVPRINASLHSCCQAITAQCGGIGITKLISILNK